MRLRLEDLLLLISNAEMEIVIIENQSNEVLCEGSNLELSILNGGTAEKYFNREVHCITSEKWRKVDYPDYQIIIVVEGWEIED